MKVSLLILASALACAAAAGTVLFKESFDGERSVAVCLLVVHCALVITSIRIVRGAVVSTFARYSVTSNVHSLCLDIDACINVAMARGDASLLLMEICITRS